jgi:predicted RND superfamily exporter protein
VLIGLLSIGVFFIARNIQFRADLSKLFPPKHPDIEFFEQYISIFGDRDNYLSIGILRSEGIYDRAFLNQVKALSDSCRALPLIKNTLSIVNFSDLQNTPFGLMPRPMLDLSEESVFNIDSSKLVNHPMIKGRFVSEDGTALVMVLELEEERARQASQYLIDRLNQLIDGFGFEEAHLTGLISLEMNYIRLTQQELFFFTQVCIGLIFVVLLFVYRSFMAMLLPLIIFLLSIVWLGALLVLLGRPLDSTSTMVPTILLIVSISDIIHLFAKMTQGNPSDLKERIENIDKVARTNFLTSLTTAVGFFTLAISPMPTLSDFGIMVGFGVLIAYFLSISIVPILFFLFPMETPVPKGIFAKKRWENLVDKHLFRLLRNSRLVYLATLALLFVAFIGMKRINANRFLTSTMPYNHEIRDAYTFFEDKFQGARDFDIAITSKEKGGLASLDNLRLIDDLITHLDSMQIIGRIMGPTTYFKMANNIFYSRDKSEFTLPESQELINRLERRVPQSMKKRLGVLVDSTKTRGAIRGNMHDIGRLGNMELMEEVDEWISQQPNSDQLEFQYTGIPFLLDKINFLQLNANFIGLLIATVFISCLIGVLFKKWVFIFIMLAGNLIPLVIIAGMMGFTEIEMRGSTSMVFSVAFVIIVDDTIHFLNNFIQKIRANQAIREAIKNTMKTTGEAIFLTTLILAMVSLALLWSSMPDVYNLGFLLTMALISALVFDLFLIPVLLKNVYREKEV